MPKYIKDIAQGTDEWEKARIASIGGTAIDKIAPNGKQREDLMHDFASELVTGIPTENFKFKHADRGHKFEPDARLYYGCALKINVEEVGIVKSDKAHMHYSPDGICGDDGLLEIKVRVPSIFSKAIYDEYFPISVKRQIQWGLYICEREWCDYVQYCPEMCDAGINPMVAKRVYRDEDLIKVLSKAASSFIYDMLAQAERIRSRNSVYYGT